MINITMVPAVKRKGGPALFELNDDRDPKRCLIRLEIDPAMLPSLDYPEQISVIITKVVSTNPIEPDPGP